MLPDELKAFERFLDEKTWSTTTIAMYQYLVNRLASWMVTKKKNSFSELSIREVKEFLAIATWGNSMTRKLNSVLVQFMTWQFGVDHSLAKWRVRREIAPPQRTLNEDAVVKLIANFQPGISSNFSFRDRRFALCDTEHPLGIRNLAIIWMLLDTGFRSNEICHLRMSHLDMTNRTIAGHVKFGKWRTAMFTETTATALSEWLSARAAFVRADSNDHIFIGVINGFEGVPLQHSGLRSMIRKLGVLAGVGQMSPHDFRRTFATLAIRNGASLRSVQEAGGWKNSEMVMHYTRAITGAEILPHLPGNILHIKSPTS